MDPQLRLTRAQIVGAAGDQLAETGSGDFVLGDVAGRLGASAEAVTFWFQNEDELLIALMEARQQWFIDEARERFRAAGNAVAGLSAVFELAAEDLNAILWIRLWERAITDRRARAVRQTLADRYRLLFEEMIISGQEAGELNPAAADQTALILCSLVDGLMVQGTLDGRSAWPAAREAMLDAGARIIGAELRT